MGLFSPLRSAPPNGCRPLVILTAVALAGCSGGLTAPVQVDVVGTVRAFETGEPVAGAIVQIRTLIIGDDTEGLTILASTTTDPNGRYRLGAGLTCVLGQFGADVRAAAAGLEGIEFVRCSGSEQTIDVTMVPVP